MVDKTNYPEDVETNQSGIEIAPLARSLGAVAWYSLKGQKIDQPSCHSSDLQVREVIQPKGTTWNATTASATPVTIPLNMNALSPEGAGIVGLDFGPLSTHDLADMLAAAQASKDPSSH